MVDMEAGERQHEVVIIGGGVAGLSAARELLDNGCSDFCLVEAQERLGGRVKQVHGIAPWPLDAGAEIIHGEGSDVATLLQDVLHMELTEREYPNYVYWHDKGVIEYVGEQTNVTHPVVKHMYDLLDELGELPTEEASTEHSVEKWLQERCTSPAEQRTAGFADAFYANDIGSELAAVGMAEAAWEARNWSDGECTLVKGASFASLVSLLARGVPVRLSWPVSAIIQHAAYSGDACVTVTGPDGERIRAKAVICAVPLTQLQKRAITFEPLLEVPQQRLLDAITVKNAVKVWATFREPFWLSSSRLAAAAGAAVLDRVSGDEAVKHSEERAADNETTVCGTGNECEGGSQAAPPKDCQRGPEFWDILCPDLEFPEIWAPRCDGGAENGASVAEVHSSTAPVHVLTAFVCASKADALSRVGPEAAVQKLLAQLDLVFRQHQSGHSTVEESVGPATAAFVRGGMVDWSKEPFIEGGYSSPSKGVPAGARAGLQETPGGMLFFAGEHTHEKLNSCLQGAMQTGRCAAQSVLNNIISS